MTDVIESVGETFSNAAETPKKVKSYSDAVAYTGGLINVTIVHEDFGEMPYTYDPNDTSPIALELKELFKADGVVQSKLKKCPTIKVHAAFDARVWRNSELLRADVIINKIEDFEIEGDSKSWRQYRVALRNWPDVKGFPAEKTKPVAPDTVDA